ncbi:helix-turn-helix domain-containing protein [Streptomyces sp. NBC_01288]|uniref:hypothetical protein n=1 Tax=Streptomyces sp. NBC_01288 TaxID=2903814 RepID=UPI003FA392A9|nr:helix-turn-helix domain-containing protein [Streptomyces sp. NBC_01288]
MTGKLNYRWRLREVMANRGMFSTTDPCPLLAERGITLSASQTYRLVIEQPDDPVLPHLPLGLARHQRFQPAVTHHPQQTDTRRPNP